MKKKYNVQIDCPVCASKMEGFINKIDGVLSCTINFMTLKMNIEFKDDCDINETMKKIIKVCKKVDSDFEIDF